MTHRVRAVSPYLLLIALLAFDYFAAPLLVPFGRHFTAALTATLAVFHFTGGVIVAIRARHTVGGLRWPVHYRWVVCLWLFAEAAIWVQASWVWWIAPRQTPFWSQIGSRLFLVEITAWMIVRTFQVAEVRDAAGPS